MRSTQFSALDAPLAPAAKIPVPPAGSLNAPVCSSYVVYAGPLACGCGPGGGPHGFSGPGPAGGGLIPSGGAGGGSHFG
jgi:hypothetical protein